MATALLFIIRQPCCHYYPNARVYDTGGQCLLSAYIQYSQLNVFSFGPMEHLKLTRVAKYREYLRWE